MSDPYLGEVLPVFDSRKRSSMILNYDILLYIMPFLVTPEDQWHEQRDLLALMLTCRTLYHGGMPVFLGGEIQISYDPIYVSYFCDYFLNHPRRIRYLRDLRLEYVSFPRHTPSSTRLNVTGRLAEVLSQARELKSLHITSVEDFLESDERLSPAISSLNKLERLCLYNMSDRTIKMVMAIQSPISHAEICFTGDVRPPNDTEHDPISVLENFKDHLTEMQIYWPPSQSMTVQYQKVRSVHIEIYFEDDLELLVHCFPNLHNLSLVVAHSYHVDDAEEVRHRNQLVVSTGWDHLDCVSCDIRPCYALGLRCKTRVWRGLHLTSETKSEFHALLEDIRPSYLEVIVRTRSVDFNEFDDLFPQSRITHLDIKLPLRGCPIDITEIMEKLVLWVSKLELIYLNVVIQIADLHCYNYGDDLGESSASGSEDGDHESAGGSHLDLAHDNEDFQGDISDADSSEGNPTGLDIPSSIATPDPTSEYLRKMDMAAYVRELARRAPSLQHVFLRFPAARASSFFRVSWVNSQPDLHQVSTHLAWEVMAAQPFDR